MDDKIPRYSELTLTDEERTNLLQDCKQEWSKHYTEYSEDMIKEFIASMLDDKIGKNDFKAYSTYDANNPNSKEQLQKYLARRAYYCAMIQAFREDVAKEGYNSELPSVKLIGIEENAPEKVQGNTIYHGTPNFDMTDKKLGKPDENGKYHIPDGVVYFTPKQSDKFRKVRENGKEVLDANGNPILGPLIERDVCGEKWAKLNETGADSYVLGQDLLDDLSQKGVRYAYSHTKQILDLKYFHDFVEQRDGTILNALSLHDLRLPEKGEGLSSYLSEIGVNREMLDKALDENQKKTWSTAEKKEPTRLEKLEAEQQNLIQAFDDRKKVYDKVKEQSKEITDYEKSE